MSEIVNITIEEGDDINLTIEEEADITVSLYPTAEVDSRVVTYRDDAQTAATNAASSATAAAASATSASTSATSAAASATSAANSSTAAATSETNAGNSATAAATSATNASNSATSASTSATNSANSATASAASATAAATSETNAAASASAAAAQVSTILYRDTVFITSASSPLTISSSDKGKLYSFDTSGGAITVNLPQISGLTLPFNVGFVIDTAGNSVTINRAGTDTIGSATSKVLTGISAGCTLVADTDPAPDRWTVIDYGSIADNSVSTAKIQDSAVTTNKIADLNVTTGKLAANAVTPAKLSQVVQELKVHTGNGWGSTNTKIRRFTTSSTIGASIIAYADSATNGATFTANVKCKVTAHYTDNFNASTFFGLTRNSSSLTTNISALAAGSREAMNDTSAAADIAQVSWSGILAAGDVLRAHGNGAAVSSEGSTYINIMAEEIP